mmetsp:Transcript_50534/g.132260  ORF Transcript_50534/g.132260 Transcript_50534/m.132260 type:complete len:235 (+) Transcript_50534:3560-4264(+)
MREQVGLPEGAAAHGGTVVVEDGFGLFCARHHDPQRVPLQLHGEDLAVAPGQLHQHSVDPRDVHDHLRTGHDAQRPLWQPADVPLDRRAGMAKAGAKVQAIVNFSVQVLRHLHKLCLVADRLQTHHLSYAALEVAASGVIPDAVAHFQSPPEELLVGVRDREVAVCIEGHHQGPGKVPAQCHSQRASAQSHPDIFCTRVWQRRQCEHQLRKRRHGGEIEFESAAKSMSLELGKA